MPRIARKTWTEVAEHLGINLRDVGTMGNLQIEQAHGPANALTVEQLRTVALAACYVDIINAAFGVATTSTKAFHQQKVEYQKELLDASSLLKSIVINALATR